MRIKKKKSNVGLDIGTNSLKIIEVLSNEERPFVKNINVHELPPGSSEQNLPKGIKSLLETANIATKEVSISISGSGVVVRFIDLPLMQEPELSQALPYEAEKYIPFDIKEIILDHVVLEKNQANGKMKILLVGAKKSFVEKRIKLLTDLGLVPNIIDVDSFAILNAFIKNASENKHDKKTIALLNIGAHLTNIVIAYGDIPGMVRDINLGGANLTQALQEHLNMDAEEAQALKHNPAERKEEVFTILGGVLQKLINEIRLSFTYYENQYGKVVDEVYISGGSTRLNGLIPFLQEGTGMEFQQWDPLKFFEINPQISKETLEKLKPSLAVCSGLALRK